MRPLPLLIAFPALLLAGPATAQGDLSRVQVETVHVSGGVYMLVGAGGNVGLSVGEDGALLVDDQYAPITDKLWAAAAALDPAPVRFVVNTHWHGDHTGGNERMGDAGAVVVAHENVRERMSTEQFIEALGATVEASPEGALPVVTFTDAVTFYWNGDEIRVFHVGPAHTDGDAVVHFVGADVIHAGDTYFNGTYPFIDVSSGGLLSGMIEAADRLLELAGERTRVIPGHGPLSGRAEVEAYRDVLVAARERIGAMRAEGMVREAVVAARPMSDYDATWGGGFMEPDVWVGIVYDALAAEEP